MLALPEDVSARLRTQQRNRINKQDELVLQADEFRSQLKNRKAALARLEEMIRAAFVRPKRRVATKPSANAKRKRLDSKKQRSQTKANRGKPSLD